ncbi:MAG: nucleoside kinase [Anaerolineae bacterium]
MGELRAADQVRPAKPRTTAQVHLPDGHLLEGPLGTTLETYLRAWGGAGPAPAVAALVDGKLRELCYAVMKDCAVTPVTIASSDGMRIYQRALSFLLVVAAHELYPEAEVVIDHSLTLSGLFCEVRKATPLTAEEVQKLEERMRAIVAADEPILRKRVTLSEAEAIFRKQGYDDKVRLLPYRQKDYLTIYELRGLADYYYGYMVPSTGYLQHFALSLCPPGLILLFPRPEAPAVLPVLRSYPRLAGVFREYQAWLDLLNVGDVAGLNEAIASGRMREVVLVAEALHAQRIGELANEIVRKHRQVRIVLIAGPSSSGKTTFTKRLAIQLIANGVHPLALGIDDYFVDREHTPLDGNGAYDFESLDAVDRVLLNQQVAQLLSGQTVHMPHYDFATGKRNGGRQVRLAPEGIILAEGIHALNPDLLPDLKRDQMMRIYVSALTQLNIDHHNRVSTTDTRLLRRIVRDAQFRGYPAQATIQRWDSVTRGERRNIYPYQEEADAMFNSALVYELAVLKPFAEPLLAQIPPGTMEYVEARRLLAFLDWFRPWPADSVPDVSLLREFIGGSILQPFEL